MGSRKILTILTASLLFFAYFVKKCESTGPSRVSCPLEWVPDKDGESPDSVVAFSTDEIVSRIRVNGNWIVGRLSPEEGRSVGANPIDGTIHTSNKYEVLSNPNGCIINWEHLDSSPKVAEDTSCSNPITSSAVKVVEGDTNMYIGKAHFAGEDGNFYLVGGSLNGSTRGFTASFENELVHATDFEILESTFPLLTVSLTQFKFLDATSRLRNDLHQIGSTYIYNAGNTIQSEETIDHKGEVEELFQITEIQNFAGVSSVDLVLSMWYGGSILSQRFGLTTSTILKTKRSEIFQVKKTLTPSNQDLIKVCSAVEMLSDTKLNFVARGEFTGADGVELSGETIKKILEKSGRGEGIMDVEEQAVTALVQGHVSGHFAMGVITGSFGIFSNMPTQDCKLLLDGLGKKGTKELDDEILAY